MFRASVTLFLLLVLTCSAVAVSPKPRPLSGQGVLQIDSSPREGFSTPVTLVLYREPGIGRIAEINRSQLPDLAPALNPSVGNSLAIVTGKKKDWLRIVYDDADREGWVRLPRSWSYTPWAQFLKGRIVRLLPGIKKAYTSLNVDKVDNAQVLAPLSVDVSLRVVQVDGDWAMVIEGGRQSGWLRWRDENGRLLLAVDNRFNPQNR